MHISSSYDLVSILNDYGCRWYNDTEPGPLCLWNNHLNCCSIVPFLDSIRLNSSRCWYWANFPLNFPSFPEEVYPRIILYNLATHNQSHPKRQNFAIFRLWLIPCSSHLMSFGLKPTTTNKICSSCQIFFKAFLETVNYAGFRGILNTTQTQNLLQ